jgi:hypothetical protein
MNREKLILNLWGLVSSPECRVSTGLSGPPSPTEIPWKGVPQRVTVPYVIKAMGVYDLRLDRRVELFGSTTLIG